MQGRRCVALLLALLYLALLYLAQLYRRGEKNRQYLRAGDIWQSTSCITYEYRIPVDSRLGCLLCRLITIQSGLDIMNLRRYTITERFVDCRYCLSAGPFLATPHSLLFRCIGRAITMGGGFWCMEFLRMQLATMFDCSPMLS